LGLAQHIVHTRRVVLIHLTAVGFDKKLFGHDQYKITGSAIIRKVLRFQSLKEAYAST
jgi:hypothetical protein